MQGVFSLQRTTKPQRIGGQLGQYGGLGPYFNTFGLITVPSEKVHAQLFKFAQAGGHDGQNGVSALSL